MLSPVPKFSHTDLALSLFFVCSPFGVVGGCACLDFCFLLFLVMHSRCLTSLLLSDTNGWCPFCERVWIAIRAKGIPYQETLVSLQQKPDWYVIRHTERLTNHLPVGLAHVESLTTTR